MIYSTAKTILRRLRHPPQCPHLSQPHRMIVSILVLPATQTRAHVRVRELSYKCTVSPSQIFQPGRKTQFKTDQHYRQSCDSIYSESKIIVLTHLFVWPINRITSRACSTNASPVCVSLFRITVIALTHMTRCPYTFPVSVIVDIKHESLWLKQVW